MIQRIQSLWLILSTGLMGALFVVPYLHSEANLRLMTTPLVAVKVLTILSMLVTFLSLFMFKNRKTQRGIVRLGMILKMLVVTYIACSAFIFLKGQYALEMGAALPIMAIALDLMALRAIKKDDDLVKSIDRIR
jgi:hypothetical protein